MIEYPTYVTAQQWAASPLRQAAQDDDALRGVCQRYLSALFTALADWSDRTGAAQWPEKFKTLDDKLAYFQGKVKLALESADGPRELTSAVLAEFDCTPSPQDHRALATCHTEVQGTGVTEVFGCVRRELPMLVADVGAAVREHAAERKAAKEVQS